MRSILVGIGRGKRSIAVWLAEGSVRRCIGCGKRDSAVGRPTQPCQCANDLRPGEDDGRREIGPHVPGVQVPAGSTFRAREPPSVDLVRRPYAACGTPGRKESDDEVEHERRDDASDQHADAACDEPDERMDVNELHAEEQTAEAACQESGDRHRFGEQGNFSPRAHVPTQEPRGSLRPAPSTPRRPRAVRARSTPPPIGVGRAKAGPPGDVARAIGARGRCARARVARSSPGASSRTSFRPCRCCRIRRERTDTGSLRGDTRAPGIRDVGTAPESRAKRVRAGRSTPVPLRTQAEREARTVSRRRRRAPRRTPLRSLRTSERARRSDRGTPAALRSAPDAPIDCTAGSIVSPGWAGASRSRARRRG